MKKTIITFAAVLIACASAAAQSGDSINPLVAAKLQAEALVRGVTTARFGVIGPTVKNAPYSADGATETAQTLADGTHINRRQTYTIYRDGEGRVRRENGDQVWISDPVANVSYTLDAGRQVARKMSLSRSVAYGKITADKLQGEQSAAGPVIISKGAMAGGAVLSKTEDTKSESLGKQIMEGVEVEGTRITMVIPQDLIGNDRPLQTVHESWKSPDLQVTVLSKRTDPMMGEVTEKLTNIRRVEPDPALFQVPAGFAVETVK